MFHHVQTTCDASVKVRVKQIPKAGHTRHDFKLNLRPDLPSLTIEGLYHQWRVSNDFWPQ